MQESFRFILNIQELDINMIRLMRVKKERQDELQKIQNLNADIQKQVSNKEAQILEIKKEIRMGESQVNSIQDRVAKLEAQQAAVKKMDEFNALTHEMTAAGRDKTRIEQELSDLMDKLAVEEDLLITLRENLSSTEENSKIIVKEIHESIAKINEEGRELFEKRESMKNSVDPEMFAIYERLLKNKKDRVIVPIEKRTCSGCHIVLTPQHENLVRKGDRLVFCEHCSRILFWQDEPPPVEGEEASPRRRRRRAAGSLS